MHITPDKTSFSRSEEVRHVKTIARSSILSTTSALISMVVSIVTLPLVLRAVGDDAYGLLTVLTSLVGILGFGELGLTTTLGNAITHARMNENFKQIRLMMNGVILFFTFFGAIVFGATLLLTQTSINFGAFFNIDPRFANELVPLFLIVGGTWMVNTFFSGVLKAGYTGCNRLELYNRLQIIHATAFGVSYVIFLVFSPSLVGIAYFLFGGSVIRFLLLAGFSRKFIPGLSVEATLPAFRSIIPLLNYGPLFIFLGIIANVLAKSDTIAMSHFFGLALVAQYAITYKLFNVARNIFKLSDTSFPSIAELAEQRKIATLKRMYERLLRLSIIQCILTTLPIVLYGKELITIWVGHELFVGYGLMATLFFMFLILAWTAPHVQMTHGLFLYKKEVLPSLVHVCITTVIYIVVTPHIGIIAIPLALALGNACGNGLFLPIILIKKIQARPLKVLQSTFSRITLPAVIFIALWGIHLQFATTLGTQIILGVANTTLFSYMLVRFGLNKDELEFVSKKIRTKILNMLDYIK